MTLNPSKCQASIAAVLQHRNMLVTVTKRRIYVGPKPISNLGPLDVQNYLGHPFKVDGCHAGRVSDLLRDCSRLKTPLKPSQKLDLLKSPAITRKTLRFADYVVRKTAKKAIHLPITSPNLVRC